MARRLLLLLALGLLVVGAGGVAVAGSSPELTASGPVEVAGTEASGTFTVGDRTVRQVRYADGGTLRYTFRVTNKGRLPVTVRALPEDQPGSRLLEFAGLATTTGDDDVRLGPGASQDVTLALVMGGCETLSARSGSFVPEVVVRVERAGVLEDRVVLALPEEIRTGSPREAACPRATATSRPRG